MFDTKIAVVIRDDLEAWQKLNVTAFLTSGLLADNTQLLGDIYEDADGNRYNPLIVQPIIILATNADKLRTIHRRALDRNVRCSLYIEEMLSTTHDVANRQAVKLFRPEEMNVIGISLRETTKVVDKITKGARMHG